MDYFCVSLMQLRHGDGVACWHLGELTALQAALRMSAHSNMMSGLQVSMYSVHGGRTRGASAREGNFTVQDAL